VANSWIHAIETRTRIITHYRQMASGFSAWGMSMARIVGSRVDFPNLLYFTCPFFVLSVVGLISRGLTCWQLPYNMQMNVCGFRRVWPWYIDHRPELDSTNWMHGLLSMTVSGTSLLDPAINRPRRANGRALSAYRVTLYYLGTTKTLRRSPP
jgi:hypothetical protein